MRKRQVPVIPAPQKNKQQPNNISAIENIFYPMKSTTYSIGKRKSLKSLRKKILDTKADAYFTRTPIILPLLSKTNKKIIFESHSPLLQNSFSFVDALYKSSLYKQMQKNKKLAMITISCALKEYWVDKSFEHSRIFVLHDSFDGSKSLTHVSNDEFRIKKESTVISYVGSLYEDRGIERIFELSKIFSNCQFLVAGGPKKQKEHLEIKAKEIGLDNLKFLGWLDRKDVDKLLLSSDILLMLWSSKVPTINYCSPMKVFEYMSSGKIIVGDGYPTIKEVLTDGIDSHLSTPESLDSMISKLYKAINQIPDFTMGEKAKKLAYEKYTWENRASEIKKIIDNI